MLSNACLWATLVCLQLSKGIDVFPLQNSTKETIANLNGDVAKLQAQVHSFIDIIYLHEGLKFNWPIESDGMCECGHLFFLSREETLYKLIDRSLFFKSLGFFLY